MRHEKKVILFSMTTLIVGMQNSVLVLESSEIPITFHTRSPQNPYNITTYNV